MLFRSIDFFVLKDAQVGIEAQTGQRQGLKTCTWGDVLGWGDHVCHQGLMATRSTPTDVQSG